ELLRGSDRQCIELMRISREAYVRLCMHFRHKLWLHDSRHVSVEEKMTMFLTIIRHNECYVVIKRRFQYSSQTIHKYFHEVLAAMMTFAREIVTPRTMEEPPPPDTARHYGMFRILVGALDGTLVYAIIPASEQTVYRGRGKGKCYQNVLGICFNMIFIFVYTGWEGIAHDSRVLTEVMPESSNNFPFPPKYYLCDAAYTNTRGFMTPNRNVMYWLGDFRRGCAMTKEEKFNHAHAKLKNVIERAYSVLKARFSILDKMAHYPFNVQRNVVIACFAVNNFIRKEKINDELFAQYE
ncbi:LOW QUALITY PROTEIN: DDE_4 domain-containing protein, partial [Cephalotus follicularis]